MVEQVERLPGGGGNASVKGTLPLAEAHSRVLCEARTGLSYGSYEWQLRIWVMSPHVQLTSAA